MTTFEMRFIALRCKDTIAPTGTIAQGVGAPQINSDGEEYEKKYGSNKTSMRLFSTVEENRRGKGPCFLKTSEISKKEEEELLKAYLNMAPAQTLKWIETNNLPSFRDVEIEGTEPYITGGHTGSGYWVDTNRAATIKGLYAAGDVAGGSPQKYVTGCFAEAEIAAFSALKYIKDVKEEAVDSSEVENKLKEVKSFLKEESGIYGIEEIEEAMQKIMDEYAGGIYDGYSYNLKKLQIAKSKIDELLELSKALKAKDMHELMLIFEVIDRLFVCKVLIRHLEERKETRWRAFQENKDYPKKDDENFLKFINSIYQDGQIKIIFRSLVKRDDIYEHHD